MYVFMLEGPNENRQCAGVHEFNPLQQAEIEGSPTLRLIRFIFSSISADAAAVIFPCFLVRVLQPLYLAHSRSAQPLYLGVEAEGYLG